MTGEAGLLSCGLADDPAAATGDELQNRLRKRGSATMVGGSRPREARSREPELARRVRSLRGQAKLTLQELSARSSIAVSTLSKIENNQLSPTYENIVRLARGLGVDITALFADDLPAEVTGRRSITRKGAGIRHETANYIYEMLCTDLSRKQMIPALVEVRRNDLVMFGPLLSHEGEDLLFVVSGEVVLHTQYYEPVRLSAGDCTYFDSRMGHGCVKADDAPATIFWVCSSELPLDFVRRANRQKLPEAGSLKT